MHATALGGLTVRTTLRESALKNDPGGLTVRTTLRESALKDDLGGLTVRTTLRESALKDDPGGERKKNPLTLRRQGTGFEPASTLRLAFRSDALPVSYSRLPTTIIACTRLTPADCVC